MDITLTRKQALELRRLARRILELVPDPDAVVHAADIGPDPCGRCGGSGDGEHSETCPRRVLCHANNGGQRLSTNPADVTCERCRSTEAWEPWRYRLTE